jgi:peptide/nickel transport system substrate-binding protein
VIDHRRSGACAAIIALVAALLLAACSGSPSSTRTANSGSSGGSLSVIEVAQTWPTLDPPVDAVSGFDVNYLDAIYGQLFEQTPDLKIVPDLATGYTTSANGLTVTIGIRSGVKFQDGTPFNAQAVVDNLKRSMEPQTACICLANLTSIESVTAPSPTKVVITLSKPDVTLIQSFIGEAPNWVPSPTALNREGESAFGQNPVGAGPYEVVSNAASSKLVLKRFPRYWNAGEPKLENLTFQTVPDDQAAYAALESGSAQLLMGVTTPSIIAQAKSQFQETSVPGTQSYMVTFNTAKPPFNNILAREAIAYATDAAQIQQIATSGAGVLTQSPTGPGGLFYAKTVAGTRTYDLTKAEALVKQLGGLNVNLFYGNNNAVFTNGGQALGRQWEAAGITVTLDPTLPANTVTLQANGNWQAAFTVAGGVDPDIGSGGLPTRFESGGKFSCCNDSTLDGLIAQSQSTASPAQRQKIFSQVFQLISQQQYAVILFAVPTTLISAKSVTNIQATPNLSAGKELVNWEQISV